MLADLFDTDELAQNPWHVLKPCDLCEFGWFCRRCGHHFLWLPPIDWRLGCTGHAGDDGDLALSKLNEELASLIDRERSVTS